MLGYVITKPKKSKELIGCRVFLPSYSLDINHKKNSTRIRKMNSNITAFDGIIPCPGYYPI